MNIQFVKRIMCFILNVPKPLISYPVFSLYILGTFMMHKASQFPEMTYSKEEDQRDKSKEPPTLLPPMPPVNLTPGPIALTPTTKVVTMPTSPQVSITTPAVMSSTIVSMETEATSADPIATSGKTSSGGDVITSSESKDKIITASKDAIKDRETVVQQVQPVVGPPPQAQQSPASVGLTVRPAVPNLGRSSGIV